VLHKTVSSVSNNQTNLRLKRLRSLATCWHRALDLVLKPNPHGTGRVCAVLIRRGTNTLNIDSIYLPGIQLVSNGFMQSSTFQSNEHQPTTFPPANKIDSPSAATTYARRVLALVLTPTSHGTGRDARCEYFVNGPIDFPFAFFLDTSCELPASSHQRFFRSFLFPSLFPAHYFILFYFG
jgi:hypothetical protein